MIEIIKRHVLTGHRGANDIIFEPTDKYEEYLRELDDISLFIGNNNRYVVRATGIANCRNSQRLIDELSNYQLVNKYQPLYFQSINPLIHWLIQLKHTDETTGKECFTLLDSEEFEDCDDTFQMEVKEYNGFFINDFKNENTMGVSPLEHLKKILLSSKKYTVYRLFQAFPFLDGTIYDYVESRAGQISSDVFIDMLVQMVAMLDDLKQMKMVHGDIHLKNIMYTYKEDTTPGSFVKLYLIDFEESKLFDEDNWYDFEKFILDNKLHMKGAMYRLFLLYIKDRPKGALMSSDSKLTSDFINAMDSFDFNKVKSLLTW